MTMGRVLVTGATGFIGSHVVAGLMGRPSPIRVLVRRKDDVEKFAKTIEVIQGDVLDYDVLRSAMQDVRVIFHFAGVGSPSSPQDELSRILETNITGTLNVLRAAVEAGAERLIFASSASVYGRLSSTSLSENMVPQPLSVYAVSKLSAEHLCGVTHHAAGLETVALRYFNVYGPGEDRDGLSTKLIPTLLKKLLKNEPITLFGNGFQTRDFVHIDDVVNATIRAADSSGIGHSVINIGSGEMRTVFDVVETISERLGKTATINYEPAREQEIEHSVADVSLASEMLGFSRSVTFSTGIESVIVEQNALAMMAEGRIDGSVTKSRPGADFCDVPHLEPAE